MHFKRIAIFATLLLSSALAVNIAARGFETDEAVKYEGFRSYYTKPYSEDKKWFRAEPTRPRTFGFLNQY